MRHLVFGILWPGFGSKMMAGGGRADTGLLLRVMDAANQTWYRVCPFSFVFTAVSSGRPAVACRLLYASVLHSTVRLYDQNVLRSRRAACLPDNFPDAMKL